MINIILIIPPSPDKRIVLRSTDCSFESKGNYLFHPVDFLAVTSCLRPEDGVSFIDGTCDKLSESQFFDEIDKVQGDMVFVLLSNAAWDSDYYYFKETIKRLPGIPVYVIGDIFLDEDFREKILKECDGVVFHPYSLELDKMLRVNDNEDEVLPGVVTKSKQQFFTTPKKLGMIHDNIPRHELFMKPGYRFPFARHFRFATVMAAYGCPHVCSFCANSNFPPAIRPHSSILKELAYLERIGIEEIFFGDCIFGFYKKESVPLLEEMKKRFRFSWSCFISHQACSLEMLELMHEAGCHTIIVGIESSSSSTLQGYKRSLTKSKLEPLIIHANNLKMSVCADFILGLENETEEDVRNTIEYGLKLPLDFASFNIVVPCPGTAIRENLKKQGVPSSDLTNYDVLGRSGNIGNKYLSGKEIIKLRNSAVRRFYLRPSLLFRRLRKTSSWEHFKIQFLEMISILRKVS